MLMRLCATLLCVGLLVACGDAAEPEAEQSAPSASEPIGGTVEPTPSPPPSQPTAVGPEIVAADSEFGSMLFDSTGQAIYLFDIEASSTPTCYDACALAWPPVLTEAEPVAGAGVQAALLATTPRSDGTLQVTYNGHPLYFYAHEGKHEVKCHDVFLNGGNWYVVQPGGSAAPPVAAH